MYTSCYRMYSIEVLLKESISDWFGGQQAEECWRLADLSEENAACGWKIRSTWSEIVWQRLIGTS